MLSDNYPYCNGTVWAFNGMMRRVLTYLDGDIYVLLGMGKSIVGWPACVMNAQHFENGQFLLKAEELPERLKEWECLGYWKGIEWPEACQPESLSARRNVQA